ncbi:Dbl homology domain-containing protein [Catenaria anguillulae PL171]|uniref:Dbl homology domain-containing protein n=1 Tax=Catenaria anguillulae PL171 TaxID=765915 RepID=A0A1Y2HB81_9FUNG|nr:Dbl homology domain-containing protein [Catenaria anguillulae PL171]
MSGPNAFPTRCDSAISVDRKAHLQAVSAEVSRELNEYLENMLGDLHDAELMVSIRKEQQRRAAEDARSDFQRRHRLKAIEEIASSERTYLEMLAVLINEFAVPLRSLANTKKPILQQSDVNRLFSNIDEVFALHGTLLQELETRLSTCNHQQLSDIFIHMQPYFKVYRAYVINYVVAIETLNRCAQENSEFAKFLDAAFTNPRTNGLELRSYLILPVQRIPRYVMLLESVLKHTPHDHPDHLGLVAALELMRDMADHLNHSVKDHEAQLKVADMRALLLSGTFKPHKVAKIKELTTPARRFVHRGYLWTTADMTKSAYEKVQEKTLAKQSAALPMTMSALSGLPLFTAPAPKKKAAPTPTPLATPPQSPGISPNLTRRTSSGQDPISEALGLVAKPSLQSEVKELAAALETLPGKVHIMLFSDMLLIAAPTESEKAFEYIHAIDLRMARLVTTSPNGLPPSPALDSTPANPNTDPAAPAPPTFPIHLLISSISPAGTAYLDFILYAESTTDCASWHSHISSTLDRLNDGVIAHTSGASVVMGSPTSLGGGTRRRSVSTVGGRGGRSLSRGPMSARNSAGRVSTASSTSSSASMSMISESPGAGWVNRGRSLSPGAAGFALPRAMLSEAIPPMPSHNGQVQGPQMIDPQVFARSMSLGVPRK